MYPHGADSHDGGLLVRIGVGPIAAGIAAFTASFISYIWLTLETGPASAELRGEAHGAHARDHSGSATTYPKPVDVAVFAVGQEASDSDGPRLASFRASDSAFASMEPHLRSEPPSARSSFGERFSSDQPGHAFDDRFFGEVPAASAPVRSAAAASSIALPRIATAIPAPRPAARSRTAQAPAPAQTAAPAQAASKQPSGSGFQLASASSTSVVLAYAPNPSSKDSGSILKDLKPKEPDLPADVDTSHTAIYDITSRTVYLPDGRRLEAHSGLGSRMDDPHYVSAKDTGPTPPNVYELKMRESLFHGIRAIRLIPTDDSKMYGRDGILAHTYLLGPSGQSNGCVSFSDYGTFLDAFLRGDINRLVVVERLANAPPAKTAGDWLVNTLKDIFRGS